MTSTTRVQSLIIDHPATGSYTPDVLRLETRDLAALQVGEVRLRVLYLSLDPTNRNWLKLEPTNTVFEKIGRELCVGEPMVGEILGVVESAADPRFVPGEYVGCVGEWQDRVNIPADRLRKLDYRADEPLTLHLTLFSHIGMAAMAGLLDIGQAKAGETVLVSAAAGATGSLVTGIAKAMGCKVIGIAGGPAKCAMVVDEFGADAAIDYKSQNVGDELERLAPEGVNVFFDNVGGKIMDDAIMHMARGGRITICGMMADYDMGDDRPGIKNMFQVLIRHLRIEGFLAGHYAFKAPEYYPRLRELNNQNAIHPRAHIAHGLNAVPEHLGLLFRGANDGKLIVKLDDS